MRRAQETDPVSDGRSGSREVLVKVNLRVVPRYGLGRAAGVIDKRLPQAMVALELVIFEPADVAHPIAVDIGIQSRREANESRSLRPLGLGFQPGCRVAALRAARADRVDGVRVVPWARLESIVARRNCPDGADIHEVPRDQ